MHSIFKDIVLDKESPIFSGKFEDDNFQLDISNDLKLYIYECSKSLGVIASSINKAHLSLTLLNKDAITSLGKDEQSISAYIEMFIENSIIRIQSIYDRALIFTNQVFNLGISKESISHNLIVTNDHVKKYNIHSNLKAINKLCNEYRFIRNEIIHHDKYKEDQLEQLTLIHDAEHLSIQNGHGSIFDSEWLGRITDTYLEDKKGKLEEYLNKIEGELNTFYDSIYPIYCKYKDRFREK